MLVTLLGSNIIHIIDLAQKMAAARATKKEAIASGPQLEAMIKKDDVTLLKAQLDKTPALVNYIWGADAIRLVHLAAIHGSMACMKLLITCGADLCAKAFEGQNVIHVAATNNHEEMCRYLLAQEIIKKNGLINGQCDEGNTPLMNALIAKSTRSAFIILNSSGVDVNAANTRGETALHVAARQGLDQVLTELLMREDINVNAIHRLGFGLSALSWAVISTQWRCFVLLLEDARVDVNVQPFPTLFVAVEHGKQDMVNALIESGKVVLETRAPVGIGYAEITVFEFAEMYGKSNLLTGLRRA